MAETLGTVLKTARKNRRLAAREVGDHIGISAAAVYQWESGDTSPEMGNLIKVAAFLGIDPIAAGRGDLIATGPGAVETPKLQPDVRLPPLGQEQTVSLPEIGNRDVPVMGTAVGGDDGDFHLNGQTIDYIARPRGIAQKRGVFAIILENDSLYPAFRTGDPLYLDPNRRPQIGDDVVVELFGEGDEPGKAYAKRLVRRTATKIVVEQFNPPKEIEFAAEDVRQLLRIIPYAELVGG